MTALMVLAFISFLWIAHGFWRDYKEAHRPLTKEEQERLLQELQKLELELFHKLLYYNDLACPWEPIVKSKFCDIPYELGNGNIIDLDLPKTQSLMFISADHKLAYLQSPQWQLLKTKRLIIAQYKCESCGSNVQLQCHHITYERLTRERIEDLVILCGGSNGCHQKIHNTLGYNRTTEYPISIIRTEHENNY